MSAHRASCAPWRVLLRDSFSVFACPPTIFAFWSFLCHYFEERCQSSNAPQRQQSASPCMSWPCACSAIADFPSQPLQTSNRAWCSYLCQLYESSVAYVHSSSSLPARALGKYCQGEFPKLANSPCPGSWSLRSRRSQTADRSCLALLLSSSVEPFLDGHHSSWSHAWLAFSRACWRVAIPASQEAWRDSGWYSYAPLFRSQG